MKKEMTSSPGKSVDRIPTSSAKRASKKKAKDKPKRPLSAYNFFFKEEREKILKVVQAKDPEEAENDPESDDYIDGELMSKLRKEGGKVSFEEMGKLIGQRWKTINQDRLSKFSEMAAEDTERYKKEMQTYNGRQEAKMRSEALKPSAWSGGAGRAADSGARSKGSGDGPTGRGGYPEGMSGMGGPFGATSGPGMGYNTYGMEFGGAGPYGMGQPPMGMYGNPYGSYGMSGDGAHGNMHGQYGRAGPGAYGQGPTGMMGGYPAGMMGYGGGPDYGGQQSGNYDGRGPGYAGYSEQMNQQYGSNSEGGGQAWGGQ